MTEKYVLIGAGSAMFTRGLVADLLRQKEEIELALVDTDPHALVVAKGLTQKMIAAKKAPITLSASTDRRDVLGGATAVICTVGVGGRRGWEQDVFLPRKYGIFQPVGDSVMPGGTSRALRMVPAMVAIARDVVEYAPDALFFNYGNPMTPVCRAVRLVTGAQIVGLCHGVHHVSQFLAQTLGVEHSRLSYTAVGVNHLTWFTQVLVDGVDALPQLREVAAHKLAQLPGARALGTKSPEAGTAQPGEVPDDLNPFSWQLLLLFGAFPACMDRHVIEFFPQCFRGKGSYYGRTPGVDCFSLENTILWGDRIYREMGETATSRKPLAASYFRRFSGEHEQVTDIIRNVRAGADAIYSANLPNTGQVPSLPLGAVLESPAVTTAAGLHALQQPPLSPGLVGTLATRLAWVETVVEAALEGSREKFVQALLLDGSVDSLETARKLAEELLAAHAAHLPQFA